jgi:putative ABC transport system substrate-binding protein
MHAAVFAPDDVLACRHSIWGTPMRRRDFINLIGGAAAWPLAARAQQPERMRRIGVLQGLAPNDPEYKRRVGGLTQGLQELGWIEGRNIAFEFRYPEGRLDRIPAYAAELVRANVDVIVTQGTEAAQAARNATGTIPIVMAQIGDAVGAGLVASLARPGGNVTGLTLVATEQSTKRLGLIKEFLPGVARVAVIWSANNASHSLQWKEMEPAAPVLRLQLLSLPVRDAADIEASFPAAAQARAEAIITMDDSLILFHRPRIVELAMRQKIPVMGEFRAFAQAGALLSYAPSPAAMWRRAASHIDKIFKGAKPADLPVEQPTRFELVVNLKAAKSLGLTIPESFLLRADEVIE